MTVLGRLFRSVENPAQPLTSTVLADWLTGSSSSAGVSVNEPRVLGLPAYYRALAVTANTLAALPVRVMRNGTRERVQTRTVLDDPNPRQTPFEFRSTMFMNAISWGNAYARKIRNGADVVVQTWPIHPSRVRIAEIDPTTSNPEGKLFLVVDRHGVEHRYTAWDIFHLPYLSSNGVEGVRPLKLFRQSLGIAIAADDSAASFFANGSHISGVLQTDQEMEEEGVKRVKARWKQLTGPSKTGEVAVLDKGLKFEAIAIPPKDAQLLESRRWSVVEIARMVGTPPHLIGDVERSTSWGSGIEEQVLGWVKFTLQGWITGTEQRYTRELLPGGWSSGSWYAHHVLEGLLRGDSKSRALFYQRAILDGWGTRNWVRDLEDLEPAEGLDDFIVPSNLTLISVDGEIIPLSAAGQSDDDA